MSKRLFVVIDGTDGSGKTTQVKLLSKNLKKLKIAHRIISFPRYKNNIYGEMITKYLEGEFGTINHLNSHLVYLISLAYAGDRMLAKPLIEKWLREGKVVIANRYVSSNKAHMGAHLKEGNQKDFFKWLDRLEYQTNNIPKEDITILLTLDPKVGQENARQKHQPDIHERNLKHLQQANKIYLQLSKVEKNWKVINCMKNGVMRSKEDIHQEIMKMMSSKLTT